MSSGRAKRRRRERKREKKAQRPKPVLAGAPEVAERHKPPFGDPPIPDDFDPPIGGAPVREPRRPKPPSPRAGAVALEAAIEVSEIVAVAADDA